MCEGWRVMCVRDGGWRCEGWRVGRVDLCAGWRVENIPCTLPPLMYLHSSIMP